VNLAIQGTANQNCGSPEFYRREFHRKVRQSHRKNDLKQVILSQFTARKKSVSQNHRRKNHRNSQQK
jgi:hypothetical protein